MSPSERYAKLMGGLSTASHAFPVGGISVGRVLARFDEITRGFYSFAIVLHRDRVIDDREGISGVLHDLPTPPTDNVAQMWLDLAKAAWELFDEQEGFGNRGRCLTAEDVKVIDEAFPPVASAISADDQAMAAVPHTPGPWTAINRQEPDVSLAEDSAIETAVEILQTDSGFMIAQLWGGSDAGIRVDLDEVVANANLIAAAPEMLAALRQAEEFVAGFEGDEAQDGLDERLGAIRAAIAQAEGRLDA